MKFVRNVFAAGLIAATSVGFVASNPASAAVSDLLISEYLEGSSNNKAIELENRTPSAIDLGVGQYSLRMFFNGNPTSTATIALTGIIAAGDVFVIAHASAATDVLDRADLTSPSLTFNGDDAVVLTKAGSPGTVVDSIGKVGEDPGSEWGTGLTSTSDNTLRRAAANEIADTDTANIFDPSTAFGGFAVDTFDGLSYPGGTVGAAPEPPEVVVTHIGAVQGPVADASDATTNRSPLAPSSGNAAGTAPVTVEGIVTELSRAGNNRGFWLQEAADATDVDPLTSDGIFVYLGNAATVDGYSPLSGDKLQVTARVSEFFFATQLTSVSDVAVLSSANTLPVAREADPPVDLASSARYWERLEGMSVQVPSGSVTVSPRNVFGSSNDSEIWLIRGDDPLVDRTNTFERRVFRDAHPLDDVAGLVDNGNGTRMLIGPQGLKGAANDPTVLLPPVNTFEQSSTALTGAVNYSFEKYRIEVTSQPTFVAGVDPSANHAPTAADRATEYSIASLNVENLYDLRDDPSDGCDFTGNVGCPGVSPPFDYVPSTQADYEARLTGLSKQIRNDLHSPDIVTLQEAEDQDVCSVAGSVLSCDASDGRPDTVQELALKIASDGGPTYQAASDRNGADARGIHNAFLYRTDRVALSTPTVDNPVLGSAPTVSYRSGGLSYNSDVENPKALNATLPADVDTSSGTDGSNVFTRAAQVAEFDIYQSAVGTGLPFQVWVINNHFSSVPDSRMGQRAEQANYAAAIGSAITAADSDANLMLAGDLNTFPRPDDPVDPPSDQLAGIYESGLNSLYDVELTEVPAAAYSYVYEGQAQTLDQQFVSDSLLADLNEARTAHINSDYASENDPASGRGVSDHDPAVARFTLAEEPLPPIKTLTNREFVRQTYLDLVGVAPDDGNFLVGYFVMSLEAEAITRAWVADFMRQGLGVLGRAEIIRLYLTTLGRTADFGGVNYWVGRFQAGMALESIAAQFMASPEFKAKYGTLNNRAFVTLLYENVLHRSPDQAGLDYWAAQLDRGVRRTKVVLLFSESPENKAKTFTVAETIEIYMSFMKRMPDAAELSAGKALDATFGGRLELIESLISSREYASRVGALH